MITEKEDIIIHAKNIFKLYGMNKEAAKEMLRKGIEKDEILKKTGVTVALNDVSFEIERGKIFAFIGLSGSGKSTILRCLNRLCHPSSGSIFFDGIDMGKLKNKELLEFRRKKISMIFQNFGLMSHRDVLNNVVYGLEICGIKKEQREARAMEMIKLVGLEGWERKSIESLSGGMRQRVGIARALTSDPDVILMDEPFSALDPLVRQDMQFELLSIQERLNNTVVFITHDINEAFKLGNMVAIMKDGRIVQIDTPEKMSSNPVDKYVENFINNADKTQVYSVKHIMQKPGCLIKAVDGVNSALKQMRQHGVSSAYVVGEKMIFKGVLTLEKALSVKTGELNLQDAIETNIPTTSKETQVSELLPVAASTKFPIAVVDDDSCLCGIVTKAKIIASMI